MHRKYIRATADTVERDVPITTFIAGEYLIYDGNAVATAPIPPSINTPSTTVVNTIVIWSDTTGTSIDATPITANATGDLAAVATLNGINPDTFAIGPGVSAADNLTSFPDTAGRVLADSGIAKANVVQNIGAEVTSGHLVSFAGTTGRLIIDSGIVSANLVLATSPGTANHIARFDGSTRFIKDSSVTLDDTGNLAGVNSLNGKAVAQLVSNAASVTDNTIARFNGTSGQDIQSSTVAINDLGDVTGVNSLNGINLAQLVSNASTAADNALARFNGATGKIIQNSAVTLDDSGSLSNVLYVNSVLANDIVSSSVTGGSRVVPVYTGGKAIYPSTVTIDPSGNLAGVAGINTIDMGDYSYRNAGVGGAKAIAVFDGPDYGSLASRGVFIDSAASMSGVISLSANTVNCTNLNATTINGVTSKIPIAHRTGTAVIGSTLTIPANASMTLPNAADYVARWVLPIALNDTSGNIEIVLNWSTGTATGIIQIGIGAIITSTSGFTNSFSTASAPPTFALTIDLALAGASAGTVISVGLRKSSGTTFTVYSGTAFAIQG